MSRFFDIRPPRPKPAPPAAHRRRNNGCGWFILIALVLIIGVLAWQVPLDNLISNGTKPSSNTKTSPNNFELFDDSGQSNLTENTVLSVRILNASGEDEPAEEAQKLLTDAGIKIEQIGTSVNIYEQTIVYHKKDQLAQGEKIENTLKTTFQTKLQESENLGGTYDVLVIVGQK